MILLFPQLSNNIYFCQFLEEQGGGGGCSSSTQGHLVIWVHFFSCDETSFQARKNTIYLKCVVVFILLYFNKNLDSSHSHTKSIIKLYCYIIIQQFFSPNCQILLFILNIDNSVSPNILVAIGHCELSFILNFTLKLSSKIQYGRQNNWRIFWQ